MSVGYCGAPAGGRRTWRLLAGGPAALARPRPAKPGRRRAPKENAGDRPVDHERLLLGCRGSDPVVAMLDPARRAHPVEGLVRLGVGVHCDRAVGLEDHEAARGREPGTEAPLVLHGAVRHEHAHASRCSTGPCRADAGGLPCAGSRPEGVHAVLPRSTAASTVRARPAHLSARSSGSGPCSSTVSTARR
jgi:hypothetical protein